MVLLSIFTFVTQGLLGAGTVWFGLDHTWVAAHMGNSMLLLAALILLATFAWLGTDGYDRSARGGRGLRWLALGTLIWTYAAMFSGSAIVGAQADLACPEWPQCAGDSLLPQTFGQYVNFGHRIAVGISDVLMLALTVIIYRTRRWDRRLLNTTHLLAAVYIAQVFVGAFTIWLGAPAALKGIHLAVAAVTWASLVLLNAFTWLGPNPKSGADSAGVEMDEADVAPRKGGKGLLPKTVSLYIGLMKPRVIPLLLVPTVASMLIAAVQQPPTRGLFELILLTMLGGTLATGGAHAVNQYLDRDLDARMRRTRSRAVVTGRVRPRNALLFGIALSALAFVQLWLTVNLPAALLAISGNLFYVFVYTVWLKRRTAQNIVIGGAAGAVPPLVGWAAVTGDVGLPAILFFAIIFFWTPAHFWALALVRQEEYRAAGVPMLPVVEGEEATRRGILKYAVLLLVVTLLPFATHSLGLLYLATALTLGLVFVGRAAHLLMRDGSTARAWSLFKYSNTYLALLYLAMVVDRVLVLS